MSDAFNRYDYWTNGSSQTLADAGIVPSHDVTYRKADIEKALNDAHGAQVTIRCHGGAFNEIWYHYNVAGRLQTGTFEPANAGTSKLIPSNLSSRRKD